MDKGEDVWIVSSSMSGHWDELDKRTIVYPDSGLPTSPALAAGIEGGLNDVCEGLLQVG